MDTNILLYAADRDSLFHRRCLDMLETWRARAEAWHLTWGVCYQFLRVRTHRGATPSPWPVQQAWNFLNAVLSSPAIMMLVPSSRHGRVLSELLAEMPHLSGNIMHDVTTVALMREHGVRTIYTRDMDFHRFAGIEVIDPAA